MSAKLVYVSPLRKFIPIVVVLSSLLAVAFMSFIIFMITQISFFWFIFTTILVFLFPTTFILAIVMLVVSIRAVKKYRTK